MKLKANSIKDLFIHLAIIIGVASVLILGFFYVYLPITTNHGESITVPDLYGVEMSELEEFLLDRDLRYEITPDSGYSAEFSPFAVLTQTPAAGQKVKENRKIYLSINAKNPPTVKMPNLVDGSLKNAQMVLDSYGLILGEIEYEAHEFQNAVLGQNLAGKAIEAGTYISKGSAVDLVIGNGLGRAFAMPELLDLSQEEAEFLIKGSGLRLGTVHTRKAEDKATGTVVHQYPAVGNSVRTGSRIDIWIVAAKSDEDLTAPTEQ
jgi:beta-lactam-binding protein with PASTA domain